MKTVEIRSDIINRISKLSKSQLYRLQGYIENCEHEEIELEDWKALTPEQKIRMNESISQLASGKVVAHVTVMTNLKKKVGNA